MLRPASTRRFLLRRPLVLVPVLALGAVAAAVPVAYVTNQVHLTVTGVRDGALLGAKESDALTLRVAAEGSSAKNVKLTLDGQPVTGRVDGRTIVFQPSGLKDGKHTFQAKVSGRLPMTSSSATRTFTVDTTPPTLTLDDTVTATSLRKPVTVKGTAKGASKVTVDGKPVALHNGAFTPHVRRPARRCDVRRRRRSGQPDGADAGRPRPLPEEDPRDPRDRAVVGV